VILLDDVMKIFQVLLGEVGTGIDRLDCERLLVIDLDFVVLVVGFAGVHFV
jgi:hypothetical protein